MQCQLTSKTKINALMQTSFLSFLLLTNNINGEKLSTNNLKMNVINKYMRYHIYNYLLMSKLSLQVHFSSSSNGSFLTSCKKHVTKKMLTGTSKDKQEKNSKRTCCYFTVSQRELLGNLVLHTPQKINNRKPKVINITKLSTVTQT